MALRPSSRPVAQIAVDQLRRPTDTVVIAASFSTGAAAAVRWPVPAPALALHTGIEHRRIRPAPLLLMHKDAINSYCALHHPWLRCRPSAAAARTLAIPPSTARIVAALRLRDVCAPPIVANRRAVQRCRAAGPCGRLDRRQGARDGAGFHAVQRFSPEIRASGCNRACGFFRRSPFTLRSVKTSRQPARTRSSGAAA